MLSVLPNQKGKLSNEPDWNRYFGVEIEYDPNGTSMIQNRIALYQAGIDTFDNFCPILEGVRGARGQADRFYQDWQCTAGLGCAGRGAHLISIFTHSCREVARHMPQGSLEVFQAAHADWRNRTLADIMANGRQHPVLFERCLTTIFPPIEDANRRRWDLGTDPSAGYELRTIPLRGKVGWKAVIDACNALSNNGAEATPGCGGHIHLDMNSETSQVTAKALVVYRFLEPLLAAPVEPSRYYTGSYNRPSWEGAQPQTRDFRSMLADKRMAARWSTRWMNSEQLVVHGTFEFRGLQGTLDGNDFKNYGLLMNRTIQAVRDGGPWGVKLKKLVPIGVSTDSILALFRYLDVNRKDVSPDLKEMRDWYMERVRTYWNREAFKETLIVGSHFGFASLKDLRKEGLHKGSELFLPIEGAAKELTDKELGLRTLRVFDSIKAAAAPRRQYRENELDQDIYEAFKNVPRFLGITPPDNGWVYATDYEDGGDETFARKVRWIADSYDESVRGCTVIIDFWDAVMSYDAEKLGVWFRKHLMIGKSVDEVRLAGLARIIEEWLSVWCDSWPNTDRIIAAFSTGDTSCVDF